MLSELTSKTLHSRNDQFKVRYKAKQYYKYKTSKRIHYQVYTIMLSEISQFAKDKYHMTSLTTGI